MWAYDHSTKSWEQLPVQGGFENAPRMSAQKVYDAKHDLLIAHGGHGNYTSEVDFKTNTWTKTVVANEEQTNAHKGADKLSTFAYDSHNGVCLLCDNFGGYIWVYDAGRPQRKWERLEPKNSDPHRRVDRGIRKGSKFTPMGFFHPEHNVLVLLDGGTTVWVYRYKTR